MSRVARLGSSPLTRGKLAAGLSERDVSRLIPAHAGKTLCPYQLCWSSRAHPRSRGENTPPLPALTSEKGSSPLTRGKHVRRSDRRDRRRLIPAHAGKTTNARQVSPSTRAHPRSRGENAAIAAMTRTMGGSSPLTRGKRRVHGVTERFVGLIPAHAGKTRLGTKRARRSTAHPRSRGENLPASWSMLVPPGSSPLTRGKHRKISGRDTRVRLIPAHAGKTAVLPRKSWCHRAHPRSRGENARAAGETTFHAGSSPLTRGKHPHRQAIGGPHGLIPAHAGKTGYDAAISARIWAHPRSRGENRDGEGFAAGFQGSSPLTRGKRGGVVGVKCLAGLIPAHAGKTSPRPASRPRSGAHPRSRGENRSRH